MGLINHSSPTHTKGITPQSHLLPIIKTRKAGAKTQ